MDLLMLMDTLNKPEIKGFVSHRKIDLDQYDGDEKTKAVILINKNAFGISNLIKQVIDIEEVEKIQNDVIAEKIIPTY